MNVLFLLLFMTTSAFALNIGVIDSEYIFSQYNKRFEMEEKLVTFDRYLPKHYDAYNQA